MSTYERRWRLIQILCIRRYDTYDHLAADFGVSRGTIYNDILELMRVHPIETIQGRGGGVKVIDGYYLNCQLLTPIQVDFLKSARILFDGEKLAILNSILSQFAPASP